MVQYSLDTYLLYDDDPSVSVKVVARALDTLLPDVLHRGTCAHAGSLGLGSFGALGSFGSFGALGTFGAFDGFATIAADATAAAETDDASVFLGAMFVG
jgi:hypothetical protein